MQRTLIVQDVPTGYSLESACVCGLALRRPTSNPLRPQVLAQAVKGTKSLDHAKLAEYMRTHEFDTVVGKVKFGKDGEWARPRMIVTQWQGVKGHDLGELNDPKKWVVVWPKEHKTGNLLYPLSKAK